MPSEVSHGDGSQKVHHRGTCTLLTFHLRDVRWMLYLLCKNSECDDTTATVEILSHPHQLHWPRTFHELISQLDLPESLQKEHCLWAIFWEGGCFLNISCQRIVEANC